MSLLHADLTLWLTFFIYCTSTPYFVDVCLTDLQTDASWQRWDSISIDELWGVLFFGKYNRSYPIPLWSTNAIYNQENFRISEDPSWSLHQYLLFKMFVRMVLAKNPVLPLGFILQYILVIYNRSVYHDHRVKCFWISRYTVWYLVLFRVTSGTCKPYQYYIQNIFSHFVLLQF